MIKGKNDTWVSNTEISFDDWFSWCQTCRHGGHAKHLLDWFSSHDKCPVTGCECLCSQI
jgi:WD repeat-containing protein mio